jgi:xanthine dehydrogenase accessory factor
MSPYKQVVIWKLGLSSLERGIPVLLLYVLESKGSSPGRQGFFMTVNALGEMEGSIGGGIMEHKFTEMAKERLKQGGDMVALRRQVHDKEAVKDQSGMICSGEQTILLYRLRFADMERIKALVESLEVFRNGVLRLSPGGLEFSLEASETLGAALAAQGKDLFFEKRSEEDWEYVEKTGYKDCLYIVGGGHCALAFSQLMRTMDFYITVFDHRPGLETLVKNEYAHEKVLVTDYEKLDGLIVSDRAHHYVVVMTQGYRTDDSAMRVLLPLEFRYFGLLGSKAKVGRMMAGYRAEGMPEEWLGKVRAPAGLPIHSQTPEEIAVSIAAEIVQVRHEGIAFIY